MGLETTINPFSTHPRWIEMSALSSDERLAKIKYDANLRHDLVHKMPDDEHTRRVKEWLPKTFLMHKGFDYEPSPVDNICDIAAKKGVEPLEVALEGMLNNNGKGLLAHTFENYFDGDLEVIRDMLLDEGTIMGLGDGGAHVCTVCDEGAPTYLLSHWGRDRKRGPTIPLEFLIKKHTLDSAKGYGLSDRGLIKAGYKADINVIDYEELALLDAEIAYDLPAGGKRLIQKARGYKHTLVSGIEIIQQDEQTGNLPGRLLK
jgi:N-acyl-D-aspartate/D-glutamate deacylase